MSPSELLRAGISACVLCSLWVCGPGCGDGGGETGTTMTQPAKQDFSCQLGSWTQDDGFLPFGDDAHFELQMGFQGFLLVVVHAQTDDASFAVGDATMTLQIDGANSLNGQQPAVVFQDGVSQEILLFFTGNYLSYYEGRTASLAVRIEDATRTCLVVVPGTLVDEDPCIHTGSDPICPEDTGA